MNAEQRTQHRGKWLGRSILILAVFAVLAVRGFAQSNQTCTATLLNRSVQLGPGGSYSFPNIQSQQGYYRVRITCTQDGVTTGGQSDLITLQAFGATTVGPITFGP